MLLLLVVVDEEDESRSVDEADRLSRLVERSDEVDE